MPAKTMPAIRTAPVTAWMIFWLRCFSAPAPARIRRSIRAGSRFRKYSVTSVTAAENAPKSSHNVHGPNDQAGTNTNAARMTRDWARPAKALFASEARCSMPDNVVRRQSCARQDTLAVRLLLAPQPSHACQPDERQHDGTGDQARH